MKSGTSTAGTKTVFVSRTRMILISPDSLDIRIFSGFGVSHFALLSSQCLAHSSGLTNSEVTHELFFIGVALR